jgi:hypothetical protein
MVDWQIPILHTVVKNGNLLWGFVHEEAKEVAQYTGAIDHMVVEACIL